MKLTNTPKYTHVFFDLDHTIWDFDTNAKATIEIVFEEYEIGKLINASVEEFLQVYLVQNALLWARYEKGFITTSDLKWKRMWRTLLAFKKPDESLARKMSERFLEILPTRNGVFPFTIEILEYLKNKGYKLHLITNGFESIQTKKLLNSGLHPYFIEMITSEKSQSMKPKKEIFDYALKITGAQLAECIMIGDNLGADIDGAINAGMDCVFMNHISAKDYKQKPTYAISHLQELKNIL